MNKMINHDVSFLNKCLAQSSVFTIQNYDFENRVFWAYLDDQFKTVIYGKTIDELHRKSNQILQLQNLEIGV